MSNKLRTWCRKLCGATAIEYALIAAGITVGIISLVFLIGQDVLVNMYQNLLDVLQSQTG